MAKDPDCNMNVEEKTAKYTSEVKGDKVYLCSPDANNNSNKILQNMETRVKPE